jgi:hypothetical protein
VGGKHDNRRGDPSRILRQSTISDQCAEISAVLAEIGAGIWTLDFSGAPDDIYRLLKQNTLTETEAERLQTHYLLPRERLLETIASAGRQPNVPGGGELNTWVSTHKISYPHLWLKQGDEDFSRFERFHVNVSEDRTAVDEVTQTLWGRGLVIRHLLPGGVILTSLLECPCESAGWLMTHDGGKPHIGTFSQASPGTKCLVQAIGPAQWGMRYADE